MQDALSDSRPAMARDSFLPPPFFCGSEDITKQGKDDTQSESALWLQSVSAQVRRFNQYTISGIPSTHTHQAKPSPSPNAKPRST